MVNHDPKMKTHFILPARNPIVVPRGVDYTATRSEASRENWPLVETNREMRGLPLRTPHKDSGYSKHSTGDNIFFPLNPGVSQNLR